MASLGTDYKIIDGDGHIQEGENIGSFLPEPYREYAANRGVFPALDHLHTPFRSSPATESGRGRVGPNEWLAFLEDVGIETTILYPTSGLAYGKIPYDDVAVAVCRGYNDWLHETYLKATPRFRGMALIPMQDPEAAALELRRAVEDLGMCGAMLPSNGLKTHLGSKEFWPVFDEANRLGCSLSIHGGSHDRFGMDHMSQWAAVHALGHPFGLIINFTGMLATNIFDRYPNVRFGFLEGGVAWLLFTLERLDSSYASYDHPNPNGQYLKLNAGEKVRNRVQSHIDAGRIFVGCEGDEAELVRAVAAFGNKPFIFSSDFPHEVTNETVKEEIHEIIEDTGLTDADKEGILRKNAESFYNLTAVLQAAPGR
jgi:hypothetical protein